jgi:hypothetical protein
VRWHLPKAEFEAMTLREWCAFADIEAGEVEKPEIYADDLW